MPKKDLIPVLTPEIEAPEPVKERITELFDLALTAMGQGANLKQRGLLLSMGPIILKMIQSQPEPKLQSLLKCFSEIGQAVLDLDCSQEHYQETIFSLIQQLRNHAED